MKYIILIVILILNSCTGSDNRVKKPLNDLIYDDKEIKKIKKQIKKENKTVLKKATIKKEKTSSPKKKLAKKPNVMNKKNKKKEIKKKVVKSMKTDKNLIIYKVKNINEYEEYLRDYSENSDYPNINN
tara:strand:- start:231 stop:614 length:384 start_codon:yes stop_codon:yes gene_type:complete